MKFYRPVLIGSLILVHQTTNMDVGYISNIGYIIQYYLSGTSTGHFYEITT